MPLAGRDRDQRIVAEHLAADHGQCLGLGRVDFSGHDGGAGLVLRQDQLADAGTRSGSEQANVIGDLEQAGRN